MNTRHSSRWFWPALAIVCLTVPVFIDKAAANKAKAQSQGGTATPNVKTAGGLTVITFTVNPGTIKVYLPDEMRAGDTISGTVFAEPNGTTTEERGANKAELDKFGIRFFERSEDKPEEVNLGDISTVFRFSLIRVESGISVGLIVGIPGNIVGKVSIPVLPMTPSGAIITPDPKITPPMHPSGAIITPDPKITQLTFSFPPLGQTGKPIVVTGPFDGNGSNTVLNWTLPRSVAQETRPITENVSGGFGLIAESPRKAIFSAPTNVIGPMELRLTEGNTQTTGTYRNVGVDLSAPKTSLLKGESTTLLTMISGGKGIKEPLPLTLESRGVITMEGGNYQQLVIQPAEFDADGRYTTTRGITGVQPGGWGATATVVTQRFNACLLDDSVPQRRILWNTFSGDYVFINPFPPPRPPGQPPQTGDTTPTSLTGKGKIERKGCILTLTHNAPDRRVFSKLDPCTKTGSASVETTSPTVKSTITDRSTADNTCGSQ